MTTIATHSLVDELVRDALDRLPDWVVALLSDVAVLVLDGGREAHAYGLYHGDGAARDHAADRIVIYSDTLLRDFGDDPERLAEQVERTVRHEIAHHLGYTEGGVAGLGL